MIGEYGASREEVDSILEQAPDQRNISLVSVVRSPVAIAACPAYTDLLEALEVLEPLRRSPVLVINIDLHAEVP